MKKVLAIGKSSRNLQPDEAGLLRTATHSLEKLIAASARHAARQPRRRMPEAKDAIMEDAIDAWIENKVERELSSARLRPTPTEFALYFDI